MVVYEVECMSFYSYTYTFIVLQAFLDNQIGGKNQEGNKKAPIPLKKCIEVVKDVFTSAAERDIYTGDAVSISIITKDGIKTERFPLRRD